MFATNAKSRFAIVLLDFVLGLQPKRKITDGVLVILPVIVCFGFSQQCTAVVLCRDVTGYAITRYPTSGTQHIFNYPSPPIPNFSIPDPRVLTGISIL